MWVTTRGRYGLRAMLELAQHEGDCPVLMSEIAGRIGVSRKYLHALLASLKTAGLVRSVRGSGGGYCLSRDPRQITIDQILTVLEGCGTLVECVENAGVCPRACTCAARSLWAGLGQAIQTYLASITLYDLAHSEVGERIPAGACHP